MQMREKEGRKELVCIYIYIYICVHDGRGALRVSFDIYNLFREKARGAA